MNAKDRKQAREVVENILGSNVEQQAELTEKMWGAIEWAVKNKVHPVVVLYILANYENAMVRELGQASSAFESKSDKWKADFTQEILKQIFSISLEEHEKAVKYVETGDAKEIEHKLPYIEEINKKQKKGKQSDTMYR